MSSNSTPSVAHLSRSSLTVKCGAPGPRNAARNPRVLRQACDDTIRQLGEPFLALLAGVRQSKPDRESLSGLHAANADQGIRDHGERAFNVRNGRPTLRGDLRRARWPW